MKNIVSGFVAFALTFFSVLIFGAETDALPAVMAPVVQCVCGTGLAPQFIPGNGCSCGFLVVSTSSGGSTCNADCTAGPGCTFNIEMGFTGAGCTGGGIKTVMCNADCGTGCTSEKLCPGGGRVTVSFACSGCTQI